MTVSAIIVAAGTGSRMAGDMRKQYVPLGGPSVLSHTLSVFEKCPAVHNMFLVVPNEDFQFCREQVLAPVGPRKMVTLVPGGSERTNSVYNGLSAVKGRRNDIVVIHDGVRPFITGDRLTACIDQAKVTGACILGIPVVDTLKHVSPRGYIERTIERETIWKAQTPQAFRYHLIMKAHETAIKEGYPATDDASLVERLGINVKVIPGSSINLKITTKDDLLLAEAINSLKRNDQ